MKYSARIDLAQAHLINETLKEHYDGIKIDLYDLVLLSHIKDLYSLTEMDKLIITDAPHEEISGMVMVRVDYDNITTQIPLLNLNSTVSISRRITKLEKLGLVYKITAPNKFDGGKNVYLSLTKLANILNQKVSNNDETTEGVINSSVKRLLTVRLSTLLTDELIRYTYTKKYTNTNSKKNKQKKENDKTENSGEKSISPYNNFIKLLRQDFKENKLLTFESKINDINKTKKAFKLFAEIPNNLHIRFREYVKKNRNMSARLDKWLVAVYEGNEKDLNYGDSNKNNNDADIGSLAWRLQQEQNTIDAEVV